MSVHVAIAVLAALAASPARAETLQPLPSGQSHYMEACGGCHGLNGVSSRRDVPQLRDYSGDFVCTDEAREYVLRLPNIAFANMTPQKMADTMNFVVFQLGGASVPKNAKPFTSDEVLIGRAHPLKGMPLAEVRQGILSRARAACAARR